METKFVLVSLLLLQLAVTVLSKVPGDKVPGGKVPGDKVPGGKVPGGKNPVHKPHGSQKTVHEPGGPAGGIPKPGSKPQVEFGGVDDPAMPAPGGGGGGGGGGGNKKWCIAKGGIQKSLLKKDFDDLCKEVDCKPTDGNGLCYTESIFAKASYAMNIKYQKNGQKDADCVYGGRAEITTKDPSWGKCILPSS